MTATICHLLDKDVNLDAPYFWSIVRQHDKSRFRVMFCTTQPTALRDRFVEAGADVISLNAPDRLRYPMAIARLARLLRKHKVSIVHAHFFDPTIVGLLAAKLAGVRFVFTRHHSDHNIRINKRWHVMLDAWCGRAADRVIAVSEATRQIMIDVENVPGSNIETVHNGMNMLQPPTAGEVDAVRRELGITTQNVILTLARLHEEKGHRYLFDALPEIIKRTGPVILILGGDGPHRQQLEEDVERRGLQDVVRFLGRRRDVPALLAASTLFVLPSLAESFGYVLVEAMSLGKAVVATTTGGVPEIVISGETGILVPREDSAALADAVSILLGNRELRESYGAAGSRRAPMFNFDRMIRGYEAVYGKVLNGDSTHHA